MICRNVVIICRRPIAFQHRAGLVLEGRDIATIQPPEGCRIVGDYEHCTFSSTGGSLLHIVAPSPNISVYREDDAVVVKRGPNAYVFPAKIYDVITANTVETYWESGTFFLHGVILYGPPGTGKTTFVSDVLRWLTGAHYVRVNPAQILSKWVGESEKRLNSLLMDVVEKARLGVPALVDFSDVSFVLFPRTEGEPPMRGGESVMANLQEILLNTFDTIYQENLPVVIAFTTNHSTTNIDAALRRRAIPIPVPPPIPKYVDIWARYDESPTFVEASRLFGRDKVVEFVRSMVTRGYSWGYVMRYLDMARALKRLDQAMPEPLESISYAFAQPRGVLELNQAPPDLKMVAETITPGSKLVPTLSQIVNETTKPEYRFFAEPLAYLLAELAGKHLIVARRPEYALDAAQMAQQIGAYLLIPGDLRPELVYAIEHMDVVAFATYRAHGGYTESWTALEIDRKAAPNSIYAVRQYILRAIATYYGVKCSYYPTDSAHYVKFAARIATTGKCEWQG